MDKFLSDCSKGRENNLNLIRFVAAIFVIFSHSFPITGNGRDYLNVLVKGQIDFGGIAVSIFFFYGGFLICKSMFRIEKIGKFLLTRIKRIIPPLALVSFVSALVMGPIFTSLSIHDYFTSIDTYKYLLNSCFVLIHNLPGVFEKNSYGPTVNGVLWTLPVEFMCYIMCLVLYKLKLLEKKRILFVGVPVVVMYAIMYHVLPDGSMVRASVRPATLFFVGMICYIYKDMIPMKRVLFYIMLAVCVLTLTVGLFNYFIVFSFTYVLLWIAFGTNINASGFGKRFEMSYGIYLTAWPIQQCLCDLTNNNISQMMNFVIATIISIVCGFLICLFEKIYTQKK